MVWVCGGVCVVCVWWCVCGVPVGGGVAHTRIHITQTPVCVFRGEVQVRMTYEFT